MPATILNGLMGFGLRFLYFASNIARTDQLDTMDPIGYRTIRANGIDFHVATAGSGERLALCLHGFPESSYSWRHQMPLFAQLGYQVWAPDLRGYGASSRP